MWKCRSRDVLNRYCHRFDHPKHDHEYCTAYHRISGNLQPMQTIGDMGMLPHMIIVAFVAWLHSEVLRAKSQVLAFLTVRSVSGLFIHSRRAGEKKKWQASVIDQI